MGEHHNEFTAESVRKRAETFERQRRPLTEAEQEAVREKRAADKAEKAQKRRAKRTQESLAAPSSGFGLVYQPDPEEGAERGRGALPPAALDNNSQGGPANRGCGVQGSFVQGKKVWCRRQKRGYQKVRSFLTVQEAKGIRWRS